MAVKTVILNMRMDEKKKKGVEALYRVLGITLPHAVNMFISQSLLVGVLPFEVRIPGYNRAAEEAMREAKEIASGIKEVKAYCSATELFEDLDTE